MKYRERQEPDKTEEQKSAASQVAALVELAEQLYNNEPAVALAHAKVAHELARSIGDTAAAASVLLVQGKCHSIASEFEDAVRCFAEARTTYEKLRDEDGQHAAMYYLATVHERFGRYNDALALLSACADHWQGKADAQEWMVRVLNSLGIIYKNIDNFAKALQHYRECLRYIGHEESARVAKIFLNIGNIYVREGNTAKGFECYRKAQKISQVIGDDYLFSRSLMNLANAYLSQNAYDSAMECYTQALETAHKYGVESKLIILAGMSEICIGMEDFSRAIELLAEAQTLAVQSGVMRRQIGSLATTGKVLCLMGEPERALEALLRAQALVEGTGHLFFKRQIHRYLSMVYEKLGDVQQAYDSYRRYSDVHEEMMNIDKQKAIAEMQTKFEVERVEQQSEIYRLRTQQLEQELSNRSNELAGLILRLTEKNELLQTMRGEIVRHRGAAGTDGEKLMTKLLSWIEGNLDSEATWAVFEQQFNQIHHGFTHKLLERCPKLTTTELRICSLLKIQLASKDIASLLSLSPRTVETHRYNIRKKLQIDTLAHLAPFLSSL